MLTEVTIIFLLALVFYNYFIYPLIIFILSVVIGRQSTPNALPQKRYRFSISFVIAAYNEEKVIAEKIRNTLQLDYPKELVEIIVVSDGSNDDTADIVKSFATSGVIGLHEATRKGKSAALNRALEKLTGEIIVFSDANNDFSNNAIRELVKHFSNTQIGAVTGAKRIYENTDRESAVGDGLYWKYEAFIKKAESTLGSITAAEGEILAVRSDLMKPINPDNINDDAAITFDLVKRGYRVLYEESAVSLEQASADLIDDYNVKVRMTAGGYQTIINEFAFLFPPRSWFAFTFFSHKILRWLTPHFMLLIFVLNLFLLDQLFFLILFISQIVFYTLSILGWFMRKNGAIPTIFYIPMYFSYMNAALFMGFIAYLKRSQGVNWAKASR